ncbi:hypothetical protein E4U25_004693 [Claviceps purpurea]|nr:hypothetical protein E4U25_004693 [Claviceps purpurea]
MSARPQFADSEAGGILVSSDRSAYTPESFPGPSLNPESPIRSQRLSTELENEGRLWSLEDRQCDT